MGRSKGHYSKDNERARQQKQNLNKGYFIMNRFTENIYERKMAFIKLYECHYNACYNDFARKQLEKNYLSTYLSYVEELSKLNVPLTS